MLFTQILQEGVEFVIDTVHKGYLLVDFVVEVVEECNCPCALDEFGFNAENALV